MHAVNSNRNQNPTIDAWKDEAVYQMNQEFFAKPKMDASSFGEAKKNLDPSTLINIAPMNIGSSFMSQASAPLDTPFKEHQLKQLRAQCLVFLAFRRNILPRKLHLDIALGGSYPKEGTTNRGDTCTKEPATNHESSSIFGRQNEISSIAPAPGSSSTGSVAEMDSSKDTENTKKSKKLPISHTSMIAEETKRASAFRQKTVPEMQTQGTVDSHTKKIMPKESSSLGHEGTMQTNHQSTWTNQFSVLGHKIDGTTMPRARVHDHPSRESPETSMLYREQALERVGTYSSKSQIKPDSPMSEAVTPGDNYSSSPSGKDQNVQTAEVVNSKFLANSSKFFTHAGLTGKLSATPDKVFSNGLADAYSGSIGSNGHRISVSKIEEKQKLCDTSELKSVSADSALKHENPGTIQEKNY